MKYINPNGVTCEENELDATAERLITKGDLYMAVSMFSNEYLYKHLDTAAREEVWGAALENVMFEFAPIEN